MVVFVLIAFIIAMMALVTLLFSPVRYADAIDRAYWSAIGVAIIASAVFGFVCGG